MAMATLLATATLPEMATPLPTLPAMAILLLTRLEMAMGNPELLLMFLNIADRTK